MAPDNTVRVDRHIGQSDSTRPVAQRGRGLHSRPLGSRQLHDTNNIVRAGQSFDKFVAARRQRLIAIEVETYRTRADVLGTLDRGSKVAVWNRIAKTIDRFIIDNNDGDGRLSLCHGRVAEYSVVDEQIERLR